MKKMIFKIKVWWFWFCNSKLYTEFESELWSETLINLANEGILFTNIDHFTATFGKYKLWIGNEPYAGFNIYRDCFSGGSENIYPNREACYILHKVFKKSVDIQNRLKVSIFESNI